MAASSSSVSTPNYSHFTIYPEAEIRPEDEKLPCPIAQLPDEILLDIGQHLGPKDLSNLSLSCKALKPVAQDPCLWRHQTLVQVTEEERPILNALVRRILRGETPSQAEIREIKNPGSLFWAKRLVYCGEFSDSNVADKSQRIFLRLAALGALVALQEMLDKADSDEARKQLIDARDRMGRSALYFAEPKNKPERFAPMLNLLSKHGATDPFIFPDESELNPVSLRPELSAETRATLQAAVRSRSERVVENNPYQGDGNLLMQDLIGGADFVDRLPVLHFKETGRGDYIDYLKPSQLTAPLMRGQDSCGRQFFVLRIKGRYSVNADVVFQRYGNTKERWGSSIQSGLNLGGGHVINALGAWPELVDRLSELLSTGTTEYPYSNWNPRREQRSLV